MNVGQRTGRRITLLCSLLGYSRQAFYQYLKAEEQQAFSDEKIIQQVLRLRSRQPKLGGRKLLIHLQPFLQQHHLAIGRDAFFGLLTRSGLLVRKRRLRPRTTQSGHWMHKYPNEVIGFTPSAAHQLWVSDITYIFLEQGYAYLSLVSDAYSRKIVGYCLSPDLAAEGTCTALDMALAQLPSHAHLIHHSDRGIQYCSTQYVQKLQSRDITISMTQTGDPRDNAIAERINGILKCELLQNIYPSLRRAATAIAQAISIYNRHRLHSSLDMLTPVIAHTRTGNLKRHWKNYHQSTLR
jgi:transposase InsO family protein